ncbi:MAG: tetratricopeptide repeat protein, partial [Verrucomicrobiota bacterium]
AVGWLELGNFLEANEELEKIQPQLRAHPDVLYLRYLIYAKAKKWTEAAILAQTLVELVPTESVHWTGFAYATRRKPDGSIEEARTILQKAATIFPTEFLICFNLACYESQLGNFTEAKQWLDAALELGDRQIVQGMILNDPDLEPLRNHFGL